MTEVSAVETKMISSDFSLALVETCDFAGADFTRAGTRLHPTPREHLPSTLRAPHSPPRADVFGTFFDAQTNVIGTRFYMSNPETAVFGAGAGGAPSCVWL